MENIKNMKLDCSKTAQIFVINTTAEPVWEGVGEDGRRLYFVVLAIQPTDTTPGVVKLVESVPLQTVTALAAKAAAAVKPLPALPRVQKAKKASPFQWPARQAPLPPSPPAPSPMPTGGMHPALRMRLEKAVATLSKNKKADEHDRQQALALLRTHRDKLNEIPGAELLVQDNRGKRK